MPDINPKQAARARELLHIVMSGEEEIIEVTVDMGELKKMKVYLNL